MKRLSITARLPFPVCGLAVMLCGALVGSTAFADDGSPGVILQYRFSPNQFLRYEVRHSMTITTRLQDTSEAARNESVSLKYLRVVSVGANGEAVLEPVIEHVNMTAQFGDSDPVQFDSGPDGPHPKQFEDVRKSVGRPLVRMTVKPNGEMTAMNPLVGDGTDRKPEAASEDPNQNFLVILPETPVKVGETWKDRLETDVRYGAGLVRKVTLQRTYKLESVSDGMAKISLKTACLTPLQDPGVNAQLIQKTPSGEILFDVENGRIASRTLDIDKTEIGVFGANSVMHAVSHRVEKLLPTSTTQQTSGTTSR